MSEVTELPQDARNWIAEHITDDMRVMDISESRIPVPPPVDFILLNGRLAYPAPQYDWLAFARHLKRGGYLMLPNLRVESVRHLYAFLKEEPDWRIAWGTKDTAVFKLVGVFRAEPSPSSQPYIARNTPPGCLP